MLDITKIYIGQKLRHIKTREIIEINNINRFGLVDFIYEINNEFDLNELELVDDITEQTKAIYEILWENTHLVDLTYEDETEEGTYIAFNEPVATGNIIFSETTKQHWAKIYLIAIAEKIAQKLNN